MLLRSHKTHLVLAAVAAVLVGVAIAMTTMAGTAKAQLAGNGKDQPRNGANTVVGTDNGDLLYGTTGYDNVYGRRGADAIYGFGFPDYIQGNRGGDLIYGNAGDDAIRGGNGNDRIYGNDDNGVYRGGDLIYGNAGNDALYGGPGIDKIWGGTGSDAVYGGSGNDNIDVSGDGPVDYVNCGPGFDTVHADPYDTVDSASCERIIR